MTQLRKDLIEVFKRLSEIERSKDRYFPSQAFKSVANALEISDHYLISGDRVIISNKKSGFTKVLGASSSEVFIEFVKSGVCSRLNNEPLYRCDLDNISGIGEAKKQILINAGITDSNKLMSLNLKVGDIIPNTNIKFTQQMHTGLILWDRTKGIRISREQAELYISDFKAKVCKDIYILGSYRRMKPTVGDLDIVIINSKINYTKKILNWLDEVLVQGETKIAGIKGQTQVDIRMIDKKYLGAHLLHGTGSQEFNIKMRAHAKSLGMRLNEYGITDKDGVFHTFDNENQIFKFLGMNYVPPELR